MEKIRWTEKWCLGRVFGRTRGEIELRLGVGFGGVRWTEKRCSVRVLMEKGGQIEVRWDGCLGRKRWTERGSGGSI